MYLLYARSEIRLGINADVAGPDPGEPEAVCLGGGWEGAPLAGFWARLACRGMIQDAGWSWTAREIYIQDG